MAKDGRDAVAQAMSTLKAYYESGEGTFFVQTHMAVVKAHQPTSAGDASGQTTGDLAPETFENEDYKGAQEESKGIIGLLEVIKTDYQRTVDTVTSEEEAAAQAHQQFEDETNKSIKSKEGGVDSNEQDVRFER